jgi:hypothetical protein
MLRLNQCLCYGILGIVLHQALIQTSNADESAIKTISKSEADVYAKRHFSDFGQAQSDVRGEHRALSMLKIKNMGCSLKNNGSFLLPRQNAVHLLRTSEKNSHNQLLAEASIRWKSLREKIRGGDLDITSFDDFVYEFPMSREGLIAGLKVVSYLRIRGFPFVAFSYLNGLMEENHSITSTDAVLSKEIELLSIDLRIRLQDDEQLRQEHERIHSLIWSGQMPERSSWNVDLLSHSFRSWIFRVIRMRGTDWLSEVIVEDQLRNWCGLAAMPFVDQYDLLTDSDYFKNEILQLLPINDSDLRAWFGIWRQGDRRVRDLFLARSLSGSKLLFSSSLLECVNLTGESIAFSSGFCDEVSQRSVFACLKGIEDSLLQKLKSKNSLETEFATTYLTHCLVELRNQEIFAELVHSYDNEESKQQLNILVAMENGFLEELKTSLEHLKLKARTDSVKTKIEDIESIYFDPL